jgi:hypothetical protein
MNPENISLAHNPLLPAALVAIRRAARLARSEARRMGTAIVIIRNGRIVRLESADVREQEAEYNVRQDNEPEGRDK